MLRTGRLLIMFPGAAMFVVGLIAGLARLGVIFIEDNLLREVHGPAMIFGFVGALISLERAVAIRTIWGYLAPPLLSIGSIMLLFEVTNTIGRVSIVTGLFVLLVIYRQIWLRQTSIATAVQVLATFLGLSAALVWASGVRFELIAISAALFLVLTVVGERIELGRVGGLTLRGERVGLSLTVLTALAAVLALIWPEPGYMILGAMLLALTAWLFTVDVARSTIKSTGATRYMAICLLSGYAWLAVAAITCIAAGQPQAKYFDLVLHALLLGFIMSMIMAHASVILPAVLHIKLPYRAWFYVPLILLQISLLIRVLGDLRGIDALVTYGGIANVIAVVLFLLAAVTSAILATRKTVKSRGV